jgi:response regulator of citrate/malate metabolism
MPLFWVEYLKNCDLLKAVITANSKEEAEQIVREWYPDVIITRSWEHVSYSCSGGDSR